MQKIKAAALLLVLVVSTVATGAQPQGSEIFPESLHIIREIDDPISGTAVNIEEFFVGNRAITVHGDRVSIADYQEGTLTEIDHRAGTYSVAKFEEIADARQRLRGSQAERVTPESVPRAESLTPRQVAGRVRETVAVEFEEGELRRLEVSISDELELSREAFEIVAGAAFPGQPDRHSTVLMNVARRDRKGFRTAAEEERFSLPLQQVSVYEIDGERVVVTQRALRVDRSLPESRLLSVPAGARRVENHLIKTERLLKELDQLPESKERTP